MSVVGGIDRVKKNLYFIKNRCGLVSSTLDDDL